MTPHELVATWFQRIWNDGELSAVDALAAPAARFHGLPHSDDKAMAGPAAFKDYARQFRQAFPDLRVRILRSACEGELIAVHCAVTGTHDGDGLGIAPTGRAVAFEGMAFVRVADGRLQEGWNCFDALTMQAQLGLLPAPAA